MPTGTFFSEPYSDRTGGSGGGLTGSGPASQPKSKSPYDSYAAYDSYPADWTGQPPSGSRYSSTGGFAGAAGNAVSRFSDFASAVGQQYRAGAFPTGSNSLAPAQNLVQTLYGPQQQILADQLARQQSQLGLIGEDADYRTGALHRDTALQREGLGLDRQALGVDSNLTKTQLANLDKLRGILKQQYGLAGDVLANQMAGFGIDEATARDMAKRKTFDLRSNLTARGAFNTIANERGTGRINRDLTYELGQINVGRQGARLNNRGQILGLDEKGIGYDNQQAGLNARLANIGIDTARLGLSEQQLTNSLNDGLRQIGLDSMVSINGLLDAIGGTQGQQAQIAATILGEVMGYANLPPNVLAELQRMLSGAGAAKSAPGTAGPARDKMGGR